MEINLRKANALQTELNNELKRLNAPYDIDVNQFEAITAQLDHARDVWMGEFETKNRIIKAIYQIRCLVGQANALHGISDTLSDIAFFEKRIALLNFAASCEPCVSYDVLSGELEKIKSSDRVGYGYSDTVDTSILTENDIAAFRQELKKMSKQKRVLQDTLLELNMKVKISLTDETVTLLEELDLV